MKFIATKIKASELQPGDMFSNVGQLYWNNVGTRHSIGERVYLRTEELCPTEQIQDEIYKITMEI